MPKFKSLLLGGFLAWSSVLMAQTSSVIVFEHANVIKGVSPEPIRDATVVVRTNLSRQSTGRRPAAVQAGRAAHTGTADSRVWRTRASDDLGTAGRSGS